MLLLIIFPCELKKKPDSLNSLNTYFCFYCRIDDIEDGSELRRGQPVAHAIFGVPQTINAANYVYFIALEHTLALNHPKVSFKF